MAKSKTKSSKSASARKTPTRKPKAEMRPLEADVRDDSDATLTTNQGVPIEDNQNSLKMSPRGPTLIEDFILREKITHFDHERIPERIVHARGSGAHGYFEVKNDMSKYTRAKFLQGKGKKTPIFIRFSTVQGGSSSADSVRDVRGFATRFYTEEGNYDLVGNNFPVFIIQDAMKFPDVVHALKMEPHHGMPQGGSAHDNFWDFVSLMPETTHMVMWAMSDRGIPRSLRMIPGFGIHTFRMVNDAGKSCLVKFHIKPKLGIHTLVWDEAQKVNGKDPDFHRRDLWESIDKGIFPEWEFYVQIFEDNESESFKGVDLLDPTKMIPEELMPLTHMGTLVLNRNPDNFFAETEQIAFHPGNIVPGIEFTNDPLLQGRLFSYTDTQLIRLGGPNHHEIPINRAKCPVHNNQRDGFMRQTIAKGRVNYEPNSFQGGCPMHSAEGFKTYAQKLSGIKVRERPQSFSDHFSQATMFWNSQTEVEQDHIVESFSFELSKVETVSIREQVVSNLQFVDRKLAQRVATNLGLDFKKVSQLGLAKKTTSPESATNVKPVMKSAPSLSVLSSGGEALPEGRRVAILALEDAKKTEVDSLKSLFKKNSMMCKVIVLSAEKRTELGADELIQMAASVEFDGVVTVGQKLAADKKANALAKGFISEAFQHLKTLSFGDLKLAETLGAIPAKNNPGISVSKNTSKDFLKQLTAHKHWEREIGM